MIWRCDLVSQYEAYRDEIDEAIQKVLYSGRYTLGENLISFEKEFAAYIGCKYGIGVNSGTDALILALWCFNFEEGDEVITTPFTAIPTYSAIRHAGATPIFVDIEPDTFLIDLDKIKNAITEKTKAVVPVHLFGNVVDIEKLRSIIGPDIYILEDCAQAHGASNQGKKAGSMGDISTFSFYPTKNLGGYGDGGMVLTNNPKWEDMVRKRRMYGMINKDEFIMDGINSRLDELQAAILRVKLRHLDEMNEKRVKLAKIYNDRLKKEFIRPQAVRHNVKSVYHIYSAVCKDRRDDLVRYLEGKNIQSNVYYPMPLTKQVGYQNVFGEAEKLPVAEEVSKQIIALPFYPEMSKEILDFAVKCIDDFFSANQDMNRYE